MDNKEFLYKGDSKENFIKAIELVFNNYKATHYYELDGELIFYWHEQKVIPSNPTLVNVVNKLLTPLNGKAAAELAWEWLLVQPKEARQEPYDGDGGRGPGYKVYIKEPYNGWSYEICTIQPIWAWYSK